MFFGTYTLTSRGVAKTATSYLKIEKKIVSVRFFGQLNQKSNVKLVLNIAQLISNLVKFKTYSHDMSSKSVRLKFLYLSLNYLLAPKNIKTTLKCRIFRYTL